MSKEPTQSRLPPVVLNRNRAEPIHDPHFVARESLLPPSPEDQRNERAVARFARVGARFLDSRGTGERAPTAESPLD